MRRLFFFIAIILITNSCNTHQVADHHAEHMKLDTFSFNAIYDQYRESSLVHRRFKHDDIIPLIQQKKTLGKLQVDSIGSSFEGRAIYEIRYGQGDKIVMLWSQMHGDEPTATMALFDLFNFLEGESDGYDSIRSVIREHLTLHFIPMLNPDGAERFMRRTAQGIDMNRDARAGQTVEGDLLRKRAKLVKPNYAFNLHDQNIYYNVPGTKNPVTISLLAPAYNEDRETNVVREGAMQLAVGMNNLLSQYIPNSIAKYDDTHTPRGFGDNFQGWNASTVLIESGGKIGDPEKQEIRKLNFIIILNALLEIADQSYKNYNIQDYDKIPFNASQLHDVVLRNVQLSRDGKTYTTDIAIRRPERTVGRDFFVRGVIEDIGDLQESYGYDEINAKGLHLVEAKIDPKIILDRPEELSLTKAFELLQNGIMAVRLKQKIGNTGLELHNYPIHFVRNSNFYPTTTIDLGGTANFYLATNAGKLKYAVFNGYLIDLSRDLKFDQFKNRVF